MMWNWLVTSLSVGAKVVLYDGAPLSPTPDILWEMAVKEGITIFGTSAKYLAMLEKSGFVPRKKHDLSKLKGILSTGSPLAHNSFDYVYSKIKSDVHLASISGGTGDGGGRVRRSRPAGQADPRRARMHQAVSEHADRFLGRSGWGQVQGRLFRLFPRRLATRGLGGDHEASGIHHLRQERCNAQSRRGPDRDRGDLPTGGT